MPGVLHLTSAVSAFLAGILIIILWILAACDQGESDGPQYKCRGCFYYYHDELVNVGGDLYDYFRIHRDVYPILIAFGVILGVFWMATGAIGLIANSEMMAKVEIIAGITTYTLFVVMFAVIQNRVKFPATFANCYAHCSKNDDWFTRHATDSTEEFWGASLACFLLGMYQIAGAAYNYATLKPASG